MRRQIVLLLLCLVVVIVLFYEELMSSWLLFDEPPKDSFADAAKASGNFFADISNREWLIKMEIHCDGMIYTYAQYTYTHIHIHTYTHIHIHTYTHIPYIPYYTIYPI